MLLLWKASVRTSTIFFGSDAVWFHLSVLNKDLALTFSIKISSYIFGGVDGECIRTKCRKTIPHPMACNAFRINGECSPTNRKELTVPVLERETKGMAEMKDAKINLYFLFEPTRTVVFHSILSIHASYLARDCVHYKMLITGHFMLLTLQYLFWFRIVDMV